MGEIFRSQEMQRVQLFIQIETAHDTVDELGQLGLVQFIDLNPDVNAFQRNYVNDVKQAAEVSRKLRYFDEQIKEANSDMPEDMDPIVIEDVPEQPIKELQLDEMQTKFEELEKELIQMDTNQKMLNKQYASLIEKRHVLKKDEEFFSQAGDMGGKPGSDDSSLILDVSEDSELKETLIQPGGTGDELIEEGRGDDDGPAPSVVKLGFVTGTVLREKFAVFERILFRATRGNLFMKFAEIEEQVRDPHTGDMVSKNVFIVFYQGARLAAKIKKICESFGANLYDCPNTRLGREEMRKELKDKLADSEVVRLKTNDHRRQVLQQVASKLRGWQAKATKEKAIFHTMNMFKYDLGHKCLIAEGWCPVAEHETVQAALRAVCERSGALVPSILTVVPTREVPPSHFEHNKFTNTFQEIVSAYGVPRYREANPAVFTIITFPFLFGVMFGDVGHGALMLIFSLWLIYNERNWEGKKINELLETTYSGRYVLLLMSIFAIYCGFIYNECFAVPMDIFGTNWKHPNISNTSTEKTANFFRIDENRTYPFGIDPVWKGNDNELLFFNSLKMKMSVIFGVSQMLLGIFMKLSNAIHFQDKLDLVFEVFPQLVFMMGIFGYLCFMVFYKWLAIPWMKHDALRANNATRAMYNDTIKYPGTQEAPQLINTLIFMFLNPTSSDGGLLFSGQLKLQQAFTLLAIIAVPFMLLPKPFLERYYYYKENPGAKEAERRAKEKRKRDKQRVKEEEEKKKLEQATKSTKIQIDTDKSGEDGGDDLFSEESDDSDRELLVAPEGQEKQPIETTHTGGGGHGAHGAHGEGFQFSEVFVHQIILTIEFVLGAISNTASYLRLWALSLAHSELATVFWNMLFAPQLKLAPPVGAIIAFAAWFASTFMVLLVMESLSAFLHALRLHWVEFQNKFYMGDGHPFLPFSYKRVLGGEDEEE